MDPQNVGYPTTTLHSVTIQKTSNGNWSSILTSYRSCLNVFTCTLLHKWSCDSIELAFSSYFFILQSWKP